MANPPTQLVNSVRSVIIGTGSYLPRDIVTNADLAQKVDTSDEWITQRTGIKERRIANKDESTSFMASRAAEKALDAAGLKGSDIDGIIVGTSTPDKSFPSVAVHVQSEIGSQNGPNFDVQAVCSGFVYALSVADSLIKSGAARRFLVIGAEKFSSLLNWEDRTTCVLFGDGAGAVILEAQDQPDQNRSGQDLIDQRGIHSFHLHANGRLKDILCTDGGVASTQNAGHIHMNGREVFRNAVDLMSEVVEETLAHNHIGPEDIDWLIPHQANIRIIESTRKKLGLPPEKDVVTVDRHGNTSAASIPLALDEAVRDGRVRKNELILFEALGAGLTWGSLLVRF